MSNRAKQKDRGMPTTATSKTAAEMLAEKMEELIDNAAETMTDREFKNAEKRADEISDRVRARSSQRETA